MPNWQPDWTDVQFDHAAAHAYAAACRRTSTTVRQVANERRRLAADAVVDWEGPQRDRFDADLVRWSMQASNVADQLIETANSVEAQADTARREQAHRELQRSRWWEESQAEERAAPDLADRELAAQLAKPQLDEGRLTNTAGRR
jgi:uncharacterized protein YukE